MVVGALQQQLLIRAVALRGSGFDMGVGIGEWKLGVAFHVVQVVS